MAPNNTNKNIALRERSIRWLIIKLFSLLGIVYLLSVLVLSIKPENRLSLTEVAIFLIILIFNSELAEKIEEISFGDLKAKFTEVKHEQEKQRSEIDTLQFLVNRFVTKEELSHLKNLVSENSEDKYFMNEEVRRELRHLRGLGLIESYPQKYISQMQKQANLKEYIRITPEGKAYLNMRKSELNDTPLRNETEKMS
ncbi:hypothetical protein [Nostoc sp.]|uniref:hypothetical protein n=1 Tax=Nostoc sp. TaxID=1180 RepID=UPI002FF618B9